MIVFVLCVLPNACDYSVMVSVCRLLLIATVCCVYVLVLILRYNVTNESNAKACGYDDHWIRGSLTVADIIMSVVDGLGIE
jgi:hypothetical protein